MSDSPMHRRLFVELAPAEQTAFITALQARRLRVVAVYKEAVAAQKVADDAKLAQQLADQCRMIERDISAMERALERVEGRMTKITALRAMIDAA